MPYSDPEMQRAYQREWAASRRREYLAGRVCVDCGSDGPLEIDHVDPNQKVSHRIWTWARPRLEAELEKCEPRCVSCHVKRHRRERLRHGIKRYQAGCRCEACRQAKAAANARYQEKRRRRESNSDERLCRPPRNHSATSPGADEATDLREAA